MSEQKTLKDHQIKTYEDFLKFFQSSMGILHPIRTSIPHSEILEEIKNAKTRGCKEIGKAIIAKHALLSFIPTYLRSNKLIQVYIFRKLLNGNSSLSTRSKSALKKYYDLISEKIIKQVKYHSRLANDMIMAIDTMLPKDEVDFYFNNYIRLMNVWKDSVLLDNYMFIDAIMDDFWISHNWNFTPDEKALLMFIYELFIEKKVPFSLETFSEYIEQQKDKLIEEIGYYEWISSKSKLRRMWDTLSKKGINFADTINTGLLGLKPIHLILQVHPETNVELFQYILNYIGNVNFFVENWSQESTILFGNVYIPLRDENFLFEFLTRLKNIGTILDFLLFPIKKIKNSFLIKSTNRESKTIVFKNEYNYDSNAEYGKLDILDKIFLFALRKGGIRGYPLKPLSYHVEIIKEQIKTKIGEVEALIDKINNSQEDLLFTTSSLHVILPESFCANKPEKLIDYIKNTNLSIVGNLYFFEKWANILYLLVSLYKSDSHNNFESFRIKNPIIFVFIRRIMENLNHFIVAYNKKKIIPQNGPGYSVKQIIDNLLQKNAKGLKRLIKEINSIIFYYRSKANPHNFNHEILIQQLNLLKSYIELPEETILKNLLREYTKRYKHYVKKGLINPEVLKTVQLQEEAYYECDLYLHPIPKKIDKLIKHKTRNISNVCISEERIFQKEEIRSIKPFYRNFHWKLANVLNFMGMSFIRTPYNASFDYIDLYDFKSNEFISLRSKMNDVLSFSLKYLRNSIVKSPEILSDYINLNIPAAFQLDSKQITSLSRKVDAFHPPNPQISEVFLTELSHLFHLSREKTTEYFLSEENNYIKDIRAEINWPKFGMEEYIFSFKIKKEKFSHKSFSEIIDTREFLCIPGIKDIFISTNTGFFQRNFIHFLFPFNSPVKNIFHSLEKWNCISDVKFIKLRSKSVWFNPNFLENNTTRFSSWKLFATRIITNTIKFDSEPVRFDYLKGVNKKEQDEFIKRTRTHKFSPSSSQFQLLRNIYNKNLRQLKNLPLFKDIQKLFHMDLIWYLPNLQDLVPLPHRIIIELYPLNENLITIFHALFMTAPISYTYKAQFTVRKKNKEVIYSGIYAELRFHDSNLSDFFDAVYKIGIYFKVKNVRITPSIISVTKKEFTGKKLKNYPNLFDSFIWDKNQFRNIKLLSKSGPLTYKERYSQL